VTDSTLGAAVPPVAPRLIPFPARLLPGSGADVLGVEAALWTETVADIAAAEYMTLPRLPAIA
jgi:N-acetyl-beta-hexosaminidase